MRTHEIDRRAFVKQVGIAALGTSALLPAPESYAQVQVPNSVGTESPKLTAPPGHAIVIITSTMPCAFRQRIPDRKSSLRQIHT